MRVLKRVLFIGGIVALALAGFLGWLYIGLPGSVPIHTWIARQIATVLESYITPSISFTSLEYQRPYTVVIRDFALTSEGRQLIFVDRMVLGLAEIPQEGRPIKIREINLENPRLALELASDGQLVGWSRFIRPEVARNPQVVPEGRRFSDVLVLQDVRIQGGEVRYQGPGESEPMVLPGIELVLQTPQDEKKPGWYKVMGALRRDPIFNTDINGRVNLDIGLLELEQFDVTAALGEEQYATLPPRLQGFLRRHHVRGELSATFAGRIPLTDPAQTAGNVAASFKNVHLAVGRAAIALVSLQVGATLPNGKVSLEADRGAFTQGEHTLIEMEHLRAELPSIPDGDGPVAITSLDLLRGRGELITAPEGGFLGWNQIIDDEDTDVTTDRPAEQPHPGDLPATAPAGDDPSPNSYVRIRQATIRDSRFVYGLPGGGTPLVFDPIDINLQPGPQDKAAGWQPFTASTRTEGLFAATLAGRFDLAELVLDFDQLKLTGNITGEPQYAMLPPQAQDLLRSYHAQGELTATFAGRFPIMDPAQTRGSLTADLKNPRLTFGTAAVAMDNFRVSGALPDGKIRLEAGKGALVQGKHTLLAVDRLIAELPGIPGNKQLIEIAGLDIERARVQLIAAPEGGFIGWNQIEQQAAKEATSSASPSPRPSVQVRQAEIRNGRVVYGFPGGGAPLVLDHINVSLQPGANGRAGGRQRIAASADSEGLFVTSLGGWLDTTSLVLDLDQFNLRTSVTGEPQYKLMPEPVESIFRRHGVTGDLSFQFQGRVPLSDPQKTIGRARTYVDHAEMHFAAIDLPVRQAQFDFNVPIDNVRANLAGLGMISGGFRIIDIGRMRMELAGPPRAGGPLEIRSAVFEDPLLRFVEAEDDGFLGWRDLVDPEAPWPRLSDFVRFERLQIVHGEVILDDSDPDDAGPMVLSGIDATFRTPPIAGSPGWYRLAVSASREPLFNVQFDGRINPDAMLLDADSFSLRAELGERQYSMLPPHFQSLLRRHEVQGNLTVSAKGRVPMLEPTDSRLVAQADLRNARIAFTDVAWPIDRIQVDSRMEAGRLATRYNANLLGGRVGGDVRVGLEDPNPLEGTWDVNDVRMEDTLRVVQQGTPKYAGLVDSQGSFSANLDDFPATLRGRGTLQVINGRLVRLPIIRDLVDLISDLTLGLMRRQPDTADARFQLLPDRVAVDRLYVHSSLIILRISGDIYYDKTVDLDVKTRMARKAGQNIGEGIGQIGALGGLSPFRKISRGFGRALGKGLGEVGNALSVGEQIFGYRVRGSLSDPHVSLRPLSKRR